MAETPEMLHLCSRVREYLSRQDFKTSSEEISYAMYLYPHAPEPHNLMGILMEKSHDHMTAMRHFRAAQVLDPTYRPAMQNMMDYARLDQHHPRCRFTTADCD